MLPRITLITPSLRQATFLEECLRSIHDQQYPDLEHIVVDGGSDDGTKDILERWSGKITWWCSEPDQGQSDAINKGLARATGDLFAWINADDLLLPGSLLKISEAALAYPDGSIFQGRRLIMQPDGSTTVSPPNDPNDHEKLFTLPTVDQQSTFYRMDAVREAGGVDRSLHHVMDLELWWHVLFRKGAESLKLIPEDIAVFRLHHESKTGHGLQPFIAEQAAVLRSACEFAGERELARIIEIGYQQLPSVRPFTQAKGKQELVRRMAEEFLLKWNGQIHTEAQFNMMREFRRRHHMDRDHLSLQKLDRQLKAPNWTFFRARRKWEHLFG